jgi:3-hydroxybutyrate dehydrogenase
VFLIIIGMSRAIALEAAGKGVTSNTICPGWVLTPLVQKQIETIAKERGILEEEAKKLLLLEKHPAAEFVLPENIGSLAVFLSGDAASQMNGAAVSMDVGWTAR